MQGRTEWHSARKKTLSTPRGLPVQSSLLECGCSSMAIGSCPIPNVPAKHFQQHHAKFLDFVLSHRREISAQVFQKRLTKRLCELLPRSY